MKQKARLENWHIGDNDLLYGQVYGHPLIPDGFPVRTSRVVKWDRKTNQATTMNTEYTLGNPAVVEPRAKEIEL